MSFIGEGGLNSFTHTYTASFAIRQSLYRSIDQSIVNREREMGETDGGDGGETDWVSSTKEMKTKRMETGESTKAEGVKTIDRRQ